MRVEIRDALLRACIQLHLIIDDLFNVHDIAVANDDDDGASLLISRINILYEQAENISIVIREQE